MESYKTIFKRRSVRKFNFTALDKDILDKIESFMQNVEQLQGASCQLKLASFDEVGVDKAPYYILAYCNRETLEFINCGFCLQQLDLFIQSLGLGSLWLGSTKPKQKREDYCIMLAFGDSDVEFRQSDSEFNRLPIDEVCNDLTQNYDIARVVMLAPSTMNNQPWFCEFKQDEIVLNYKSRGVIAPILRRRLSKIDVGIASLHIYLALKFKGVAVCLKPFESKSNFGVRFIF